ncbi:MAG: protein phosphatase CheZ [Rhodospirillales bacterium]|nr:protein phosphatase CheZ [Rhodospirillales bacterium]
MAANNVRKLFSAEAKMLMDQGKPVAGFSESAPAFTDSVSNQDILEAIKAMSAKFAAPTGAAPNAAGNSNEKAEIERVKAEALRSEIRAMANSIRETKSEIKSMRPGAGKDDRLVTATSELDAVITATENATNSILEASEKIEELAARLQVNADNSDDRQAADEILELTIKILEACNFQDITGQRITKVTSTLQFVEDRIVSMIDIWGQEDIDMVAPSVEANQTNDAALLNGPALDGEGISQDDIDALFD